MAIETTVPDQGFALTEEFLKIAERVLSESGKQQGFERLKNTLGENFHTFPPYYQAIAAFCSATLDVEGYRTKRFQVGAKKMRKLRHLDSRQILETSSFESDYLDDRGFPEAPKLLPEDLRLNPELAFAIEDPDAIMYTLDNMAKFCTIGLSAISTHPQRGPDFFNEASMVMRDFLNEFDSQSNSQMKSSKAILKLAKKKSLEMDPESRQAIEKSYTFPRIRGLRDFMALKYDRTRELFTLDKVLGNTYFKYSPLTQNSLDGFCRRPISFTDLPVGFPDLPRFIRMDQTLYDQLLDRIDVRLDEVYSVAVKPTPREDVKEVVPQPVFEYKPTPEQILTDAIFNKHGQEFSRDASKRARYFVNEDVTRYNGDRDELAKSFSGFKLGKRLRGVEDVSVRNFFDDVMLQYLTKGKTPSSKDLERVYVECTSKN